MHVESLEWAEDPADPLVQHYCFSDPAADSAIVGTGHALSGQVLPLPEPSLAHMREIIVVLAGSLSAQRGGDSLVLKPGDSASAVLHRRPKLQALEDSKFLYIRFGRRLLPEGSDD